MTFPKRKLSCQTKDCPNDDNCVCSGSLHCVQLAISKTDCVPEMVPPKTQSSCQASALFSTEFCAMVQATLKFFNF